MALKDSAYPDLEKKVMKTNENFRGLSYGNLIALWSNWLLGDRPDYYDVGDILFLRGSVGNYENPEEAYDRTDKSAISIFQDTATLIPVMTAMSHFSGDYHEGSEFESGSALRSAVRTDINGSGPIWARIQKVGDSHVYRLVKNLLEFYVESPVCDLTVSDQNPFRDKIEVPIEAGKYDMVVGGYFIFIKEFPLPVAAEAATYLLWFGGKGRGVYHTDAYYEINVKKGKRQSFVEDKSADDSIKPNPKVRRPPTL